MKLTAFLNKLFPELLSFLSCEVNTLELLLLKHIYHELRNIDSEGGSGGGAHDGKCLASLCRKDILLLLFIDSTCLLIQTTEIIHIIRCQSEDEAVLAGIDDGS